MRVLGVERAGRRREIQEEREGRAILVDLTGYYAYLLSG